MKKIIISEKNKEIRVSTEQPLGIEDAINLTLSGVLSIMNDVVNNMPPSHAQHKQQMKEHLFDMFNMAASNLLAQFAPEIDLRGDIQADAIMSLEDQLLAERVQEALRKDGQH